MTCIFNVVYARMNNPCIVRYRFIINLPSQAYYRSSMEIYNLRNSYIHIISISTTIQIIIVTNIYYRIRLAQNLDAQSTKKHTVTFICYDFIYVSSTRIVIKILFWNKCINVWFSAFSVYLVCIMIWCFAKRIYVLQKGS